MVFASRFIRATRAPKQGEIALTLTVLSLITMLIGTVIGLNRPQDVRTNAAGSIQCGGTGCSKNSDCSQAVGFLVLCHIPTGQCRPALSSNSCPGVTARAESTKKDVGGSCITKTDCKTGLDCSPGRTCTVSAGGIGGGAGTDGGTTGAPSIPQPTLQDRTRYRTYPGQCEMLFSNIDDPRIMRLTLSTTSGTVLFDTDKEQNGCMPFNSPSKGDSISINYDPRSQQNVIVRATSSGGLGGADKTCTFGRQGLSNGAEADPLTVTLFYQVQQGLQGQRVWNSYSQSANTTGGCVERRNTPTPTATPTQPEKLTQKRNCWQSCTSDAQCNKTPEGNVLKCRYPQFIKQGDTNKYCLLPNEDSLDCKSKATTATPTIPTKTPTPTATPTATLTPPPPTVVTPPVCNKSVYFMIDNSSTQKLKPDDLSKEIKAYFADKNHDYHNIRFSYDTFNAKIDDGPPAQLRKLELSIPKKNWTNINAAFERIRQRGDDVKIFVSDGIPTVLDATLNGKSIQCVYEHTKNNAGNNSSIKLKGCGATVGNPEPDMNISQCNGRYNPGGDHDRVQDVCPNPYPIRGSNATHNVMSAGTETPIVDNVQAAGGKYFPTPEDMIAALPEILSGLCPSGGIAPNGGRPRTFMSSFSVQNNSVNKTIQTVTVKTCSDQGTECKDFVNPLQVAPQQTKSFSQVIPDSVPVTSRELVTCTVGYSDGSSLPCPRKQTPNDSVQFNLNVSNRAVTGSARTFLQAADVNKDGKVNAIDYVLCQKQITSRGAKSCDIVNDNVINAQDFSIVTERFGQSSR